MSLKMLALFLTVVHAVLSVPRASAQLGSCMSALVSLLPCMNYISGNVSTPSSTCCSQLASVVQAEPQCLCLVLNGGASSIGITVNQTRALDLPAACKVQTPPISKCNATGAPSAAPTISSPSTPSSQNSPPGNTTSDFDEGGDGADGTDGSEPDTDPEPGPTGNNSAGIALQTPAPFIFSLLFAAAFASSTF